MLGLESQKGTGISRSFEFRNIRLKIQKKKQLITKTATASSPRTDSPTHARTQMSTKPICTRSESFDSIPEVTLLPRYRPAHIFSLFVAILFSLLHFYHEVVLSNNVYMLFRLISLRKLIHQLMI